MAGRGGARPGAGRKRKPGPQFKLTSAQKKANAASNYAKLFDAIATPLDIFAHVMLDTGRFTKLQFEAAKAAAPYIHPRLQSVTMKAAVKKDISDFSDDELLAIIGENSTREGAEGNPTKEGGED